LNVEGRVVIGKYDIQLFWDREDDDYIAVAPDFEGSVSAHGKTPHDALRELEVAIGLVEEIYDEEGWELPTAHGYSGSFVLRVPRSLHARLSRVAKGEGVSMNSLIVSYLSERTGGGSVVARLRGAMGGEARVSEYREYPEEKHGS
jgi:antitoxin HicB